MSGSKNNHKSDQQDSSKSSFKDWYWLASISAFLALVLTLVAVINALVKQFTVAIIAVFIAYVFATLWFTSVWAKNKKRWRLISFVVLYVFTALFFFWVGTGTDVSPTNDWPSNLITYYDFETDADLEGWQKGAERSTEHTFSGRYALKATLPVQAEQETYFSFHWDHELTADVVVGQVYWPENEEVGVVWAQVCVPMGMLGWDCRGVPANRGGWNTFVLNLYEMSAGDPPRPLSELVLSNGFLFQGVLHGTAGTSVSTLPMYIDTIQIYRDGVDIPAQ